MPWWARWQTEIKTFAAPWTGEAIQLLHRRRNIRYLELLDGQLLLVTNTLEPATKVVHRYKSLADIERGFRVVKSDIEIGPVFRRLPQRICANALIFFMALVLYRVMRMRLKVAKRSESPTTLLEQLKRIHQQTAVTSEG
jgi:transposase